MSESYKKRFIQKLIETLSDRLCFEYNPNRSHRVIPLPFASRVLWSLDLMTEVHLCYTMGKYIIVAILCCFMFMLLDSLLDYTDAATTIFFNKYPIIVFGLPSILRNNGGNIVWGKLIPYASITKLSIYNSPHFSQSNGQVECFI